MNSTFDNISDKKQMTINDEFDYNFNNRNNNHNFKMSITIVIIKK